MSESFWTYWRSPTRSSRVSNVCESSGGTAPVSVIVCFTFSVPSLARLPSAMNVDAHCPRRALSRPAGLRADHRSGGRTRSSPRSDEASWGGWRARGTASHQSLRGAAVSRKRDLGSRPERTVAPGYRCACEPAAVERSPIRTTPEALRSKAPRLMAAMVPRVQAVMVHARAGSRAYRLVATTRAIPPHASDSPPSAAECRSTVHRRRCQRHAGGIRFGSLPSC